MDTADLAVWLREAGAEVDFPTGGAPFSPGDANLDGRVDDADFMRWNSVRFSQNSASCSGDFNADGVVDVADFNVWNEHESTAAPHAVSEPCTAQCYLCGALIWLLKNVTNRPRHDS